MLGFFGFFEVKPLNMRADDLERTLFWCVLVSLLVLTKLLASNDTLGNLTSLSLLNCWALC